MLLHITTNATVWNQRWQNALKRFKLVRIMLSIDAIEDEYEYIRYPAKWQQVEHNVKQMMLNKNFKIIVYAVVQNLNIGVLEKLIDWCQSQNLYLQMQRCSDPDYLDFTNLPDAVLESTIQQLDRCHTKVTNDLNKTFIQSAKKEIENRKQKGIDNKKWNAFISAMSLRESLRGNDHRTILKY
jgi:molybdenum cofactor biosynthesis enzyme MoaA